MYGLTYAFLFFPVKRSWTQEVIDVCTYPNVWGQWLLTAAFKIIKTERLALYRSFLTEFSPDVKHETIDLTIYLELLRMATTLFYYSIAKNILNKLCNLMQVRNTLHNFLKLRRWLREWFITMTIIILMSQVWVWYGSTYRTFLKPSIIDNTI